MKSIMYHYVRPDDPELPYLRHLHIDDFVKQLDYFGKEFGFISREALRESLISGEPTPGVILTFDDGFSDHCKYVLPELTKRGLWGIFYISTSHLTTNKLIDVHRIHMLLGRFGGSQIEHAIKELISDETLSHQHVEEFHNETYTKQDNTASTTRVKRLLNYFIDYNKREAVLDKLMNDFYPDEAEISRDFYMSASDLQNMHTNGMVIGSHTVNHPILSRLSLAEQEQEIGSSFDSLLAVTGKPFFKTFCYPYGGFHTFTTQTEELLEAGGCDFSFNVESRSISKQDLQGRRQALPRFDCNEFPFGSCRAIP